MDLITEITRRGGLAATHELLRAGATSYRLTLAVATGTIIRVRQGWYGLPCGDPLLAEAVRVGGRLTCISAAAHYGLWTIRTEKLHVRVGAHSSRLRTRTDARIRLTTHPDGRTCVHWRPGRAAGTRFVLVARESLRDMAWCQSPERTVAAVDSAIRMGHISRGQWLRDISVLPPKLRELLGTVDAQSESITESIVRFRLQQLGFVLRLQVRIRGVGRVDLMIGDRLVIELDGWEFHRSREAFEADRHRDALLAARGYRVLRFTYRQVTRNWQEVVAAIRGCVSRGESRAA